MGQRHGGGEGGGVCIFIHLLAAGAPARSLRFDEPLNGPDAHAPSRDYPPRPRHRSPDHQPAGVRSRAARSRGPPGANAARLLRTPALCRRARRAAARRLRPARRAAARPLVALLLLGAVACQTVPLTNRSQLLLIPEGTELQLGLSSYQDILKKARVSHDPALNEQVTRVGTRIAEATGRTDYRWEFRVLEDKQANPFCLPGGKVAVYTGILPITRDDAGLAAVLGHEVSHAIARHGGERISQQLAVQGGLLATQAALVGHDARTTQWVAAGLGAGATVGVLLPWSRLQESEADHLGLIYMARAGYHPQAARDLWVHMASQGGPRQPEFLSTQPVPQTRIAQIEAWIPETLQYYRPR